MPDTNELEAKQSPEREDYALGQSGVVTADQEDFIRPSRRHLACMLRLGASICALPGWPYGLPCVIAGIAALNLYAPGRGYLRPELGEAWRWSLPV